MRLLFLLPLVAAACDTPADCDTMAVASVTVVVFAPDGSRISDATATWVAADGSSGACDSDAEGSYACAYETLGEIEVTVVADGYVTATETFEIFQDDEECHVNAAEWEVTLSPA